MKPDHAAPEQMTEVLIMADGTIYVHNLTPAMAVALSALNPDDARIRSRIPPPALKPASPEHPPTLPL
jgi:hypothetical protein